MKTYTSTREDVFPINVKGYLRADPRLTGFCSQTKRQFVPDESGSEITLYGNKPRIHIGGPGQFGKGTTYFSADGKRHSRNGYEFNCIAVYDNSVNKIRNFSPGDLTLNRINAEYSNLGALYLKTPDRNLFSLNWHWVMNDEIRSSGVRLFTDLSSVLNEEHIDKYGRPYTTN